MKIAITAISDFDEAIDDARGARRQKVDGDG